MPRIRRKHFGKTRTNGRGGGQPNHPEAEAPEDETPEVPDDETPDTGTPDTGTPDTGTRGGVERPAGATSAEAQADESSDEPDHGVETPGVEIPDVETQGGEIAPEKEQDGQDSSTTGIQRGWTDLRWLNYPAPDADAPRVAVPPEELDPDGDILAAPHRHEAYWVGQRGRRSRTEVCCCGAYRDVGLVKAGKWAGGEPTTTPWERAHLQAVRYAVEQTPELLELQPKAIQTLNQIILKDPPPEAEQARDLAGAEAVHELALGAVQRMMEWHRNNPGVQF